MTIDFGTAYQPPGVYVEPDPSPIAAPQTGVRQTVVALVGPARGYLTKTEAIVLSGTDAVELTELGIDSASVVVKSTAGTTYANATDYAKTVLAGEDGQIGTTQDNLLTIARVATGDIDDGETVYVSYNYTDADYHDPTAFTNYEDVKDFYGDPFDLEDPTSATYGDVISPLALAAKIAFENGALQLICVATTGTNPAVATRTELSAAYSKILLNFDISVIVPLTVGITGSTASPGDTYNLGVDLKAHVDAAAAENKHRIGLLGWEKTVTIDPVTALASFKSKRVVAIWPHQVDYFNGFANQNIVVGGYYLAAAAAGRLASQQVQVPLTKKLIRGFTGIPAAVLTTMTRTQMNTWSNGGVTVVEPTRYNTLIARHGVTTDVSSVDTREVSMVRALDALVDLLQTSFDQAELIGGYIDEEMPLRIKAIAAGALETALNNDVIVAYRDLLVRQESIDPTVVQVKFLYRPAYALNYIRVSFSVDPETGLTDLLQVAA